MSNASGALAAGSPERLLVIGGVLLIIAGMIFGDIFAVFILHPNNARIGGEMFNAAQAVIAGQPGAVMEHFGLVGKWLENRGTKVDTHNHIIQFGFLALMLALAQPYVALSAATRLRLAKWFMFGAVLLPPMVFAIHYVGLAYSPFEAIGWASVFADLGGFILIVATSGYLLGVWRYCRGQPGNGNGLQCASWESRMLLRGGALLLLAGFVFGGWFAAADFERLQAMELKILDTLIDRAAVGDTAAVEQAFGAFGAMAAEKAIKIASHAHVNEVGMLALLLAFMQHLVFLSERWRRCWVGVFLIGAVGLPVSIMAEMRFGLVAGGVADTFGLLMIVALFAMLFGVWRHTGRLDAGEQA